ncbi:MAG: hypothetical protein B0D91_13890, partial [Oceanospirillales bacterium LUC14_002_19_P2]
KNRIVEFGRGQFFALLSLVVTGYLQLCVYYPLILVSRQPLEAKLARRNILIGGLQPLLKNLSDFEYSCAIDKTNKAYYTAAIWVVEPKAPDEIEKLKNILDEYAVFYAFNDGTGFVSMNNARMGNGTHQLVET